MDGASMLQIKRGLVLVKRELQTLKSVLTGLASTHRDTYVPFLLFLLHSGMTRLKLSVQWQVAPIFNTLFPVPLATNVPLICQVFSDIRNAPKKSNKDACSCNSEEPPVLLLPWARMTRAYGFANSLLSNSVYKTLRLHGKWCENTWPKLPIFLRLLVVLWVK